MDNSGIVRVYYAKTLPARAVAIAQVSAKPSRPSELTDINNIPFRQGALTVQPVPTGAAVDAAVIGHTVTVSGSPQYLLANQFFEITDQLDADGAPVYYRHRLPAGPIDHVTVRDPAGAEVTGWLIRDGYVLHAFDGSALMVTYYENQVPKTRLLQYSPVLTRGILAAAGVYVFNPGGLLTVPDSTASYRIRFTANNGYTVLPPYGAPPSDPWYVRIRFDLRPVAPEWARQLFMPQRPYRLASWVPGAVVSKNLVEFERKKIWFDPIVKQFPDILIYDKNYQIKYALDGVPVDLSKPADKGYLFPWKTSQVVDADVLNGRVQINVDLDPTDIVFGFYSYTEMDVVFTALDINPFTNPAVKGKVIEFYWADRGASWPGHIFYQLRNSDGSLVAGATNDPSPGSGETVFSAVAVGFSVGLDEITLTDIRVRGGGLAAVSQGVPQAAHFWDLGHLDGAPYPLGGAAVVMLPVEVLDRFTETAVRAKVESLFPMGTLPVVRFYDAAGNEFSSPPPAMFNPNFDDLTGSFDDATGTFDHPGQL